MIPTEQLLHEANRAATECIIDGKPEVAMVIVQLTTTLAKVIGERDGLERVVKVLKYRLGKDDESE